VKIFLLIILALILLFNASFSYGRVSSGEVLIYLLIGFFVLYKFFIEKKIKDILDIIDLLDQKLNTLTERVKNLNTSEYQSKESLQTETPIKTEEVVSEEESEVIEYPNSLEEVPEQLKSIAATAGLDPRIIQPVSVNKEEIESSSPESSAYVEPEPRLPPPPSIFDKAFKYAKNWLLTGNTVVKVGSIVLLFGLAFFFKYAIDTGWLPLEVRVLMVLSVGFGVMIVGWRVRHSKPEISLPLQGGGVGILYLSIFVAINFYGLIDPLPGLVLLVAIVALASALAVIQDSKYLAITSIVAGFVSPILVSSNSGDHIALFSYYLALNVGVLSISWFKSWRILNVIGFAFTFVIATLWGNDAYTAEHFATVEPFLIAFFLFYVAIPILFAIRSAPNLKGYVDGTLVFGVPIVGFALQSKLVFDYEYGLAISALTLGLFYAIAAILLWKSKKENMRLMVEAFLSLAVIFGTLTIPFAADGRWTSAAWAIEGAGLLWLGIRQNHLLMRGSGLLVQALAGVFFMRAVGDPIIEVAVINGQFIAAMMVAFAGLFTAYYIFKNKEQIVGAIDYKLPTSEAMLGWGLLWWFVSGFNEINKFTSTYTILCLLLFITTSSIVYMILSKKLNWSNLVLPTYLLLPSTLFLIFISYTTQGHPFVDYTFIGWIVALASNYWLIYQYSKFSLNDYTTTYVPLWHNLSFVAIILLSLAETSYLLSRPTADGFPFLYFSNLNYMLTMLASLAISTFVMLRVYKYLKLSYLKIPSLILLPSMLITSGLYYGLEWLFNSYKISIIEWSISWGLIFIIQYWLMRHMYDSKYQEKLQPIFHAIALWLMTAIISLEFYDAVRNAIEINSSWSFIMLAIIPVLMLTQIPRLKGKNIWAIDKFENTYFITVMRPIMLWLILWVVVASFSTGSTNPLPYITIINPLELTQLISVLVVYLYLPKIFTQIKTRHLHISIASLLFLIINGVIARSVSVLGDKPFDFSILWGTPIYQTSVSIVWTIIATSLMVVSSRINYRKAWLVAVAMLGVVIVKLFLIDLADTETIARIITFISIGLILLVTGYFSPIPKESENHDENK
jgi:uncharacterized membrane protein